MATVPEKLAESLEALKALQREGVSAIYTTELTRNHRENLVKYGFLEEVIKGWYIATHPKTTAGDSTAWYTAYWKFCAQYLNNRFDEDWCLSPEQSLLLHTENWLVPQQLLVRSSKGRNKITKFPYNTSLLDTRYPMPEPQDIEIKNGLRVYSLPCALVACTSKFFKQAPIDSRAALAMISDPSQVLNPLLRGGHSSIAGRLAGAFRNIGEDQIADDIVSTMRSAGYTIREEDPYGNLDSPYSFHIQKSPYLNRMKAMWLKMKEDIIQYFPPPPSKKLPVEAYLRQVEETYVSDAYHSLSIEGYEVNPELIQKVKRGKWDPDGDKNDLKDINALAARGYWQAFQSVKKSIEKIAEGCNPGEVTKVEHRQWYTEMFSPCVAAGILKPSDLAGYRSAQVYIRRSMHVPPNFEAVRSDLMPGLFEQLEEESDPATRVVLGHFFFVYIHPYMDGNGRIGRFLMNTMFASGGYPWLVIPVEKRQDYMAALEAASVQQDIIPFTKFLAKLMGSN